MMELLVVVTMISILAAMLFGALSAARNASAEYRTRATIAKLHTIIMERWESYQTRRVPIKTVDTSGNPLTPPVAAEARLVAIRQLMRLEMPDCLSDLKTEATDPNTLTDITDSNVRYCLQAFNPNFAVKGAPPAVWSLYNQRYLANSSKLTTARESAKCLYLVVSVGSPEAMEQFDTTEIGIDPDDGSPYFVDAWGTPILWLRYAPGCSLRTDLDAKFSGFSQIQSGDPVGDHDPFDIRNVDSGAYRLTPLIYSCGADRQPGITVGPDDKPYTYQGNPYATYLVKGVATLMGAKLDSSLNDNITNHQLGTR